MVTGASSGDNGTAAGGGARWDDGTEQKREEREDGEHRELTLELMARTERSEEGRRRRGGARQSSAGAEGATPCSREGASRLDCAGVEGEELEAELMAGSAGLGAAGLDGEVRWPADGQELDSV